MVSGLTTDVAAISMSQTILTVSIAATDGRITAVVANLTMKLTDAIATTSSVNQSLELLAKGQIRNLTNELTAAIATTSSVNQSLELTKGQIRNLTNELIDAIATTSSMNQSLELAKDQIRNLTEFSHGQMANITAELLQLQDRLVAAERGSMGAAASSATDASPPLLAIIAVAVAGFALLVVLVFAVVYWTRRAPAVASNIMAATIAAPPALAGNSWDALMYGTAADSGAHPSVANGAAPSIPGTVFSRHAPWALYPP